MLIKKTNYMKKDDRITEAGTKADSDMPLIKLPSASIEASPVLYAVFSVKFDKWEKAYNPLKYFIDGGRTVPYDFHFFCSEMWGQIRHQRGTSFEMFREQMLNTATSWQNSLKASLWKVCLNFNINIV
jgi:hypothetical protein